MNHPASQCATNLCKKEGQIYHPYRKFLPVIRQKRTRKRMRLVNSDSVSPSHQSLHHAIHDTWHSSAHCHPISLASSTTSFRKQWQRAPEIATRTWQTSPMI